MEKPTCKTCPYWEPYIEDDQEPRDGFCQRYAPRPGLLEHEDGGGERLAHKTYWPETSRHDFCGEHPKMDEWINSRKEKS